MICQQLHGVRMGAVVAAVAGRAADHCGGTDQFGQCFVGAVFLSVVSHFEQVRPQVRGINAVIARHIGVPRQQNPGTPVIQPQDETVVVHAGIQRVQPLEERTANVCTIIQRIYFVRKGQLFFCRG